MKRVIVEYEFEDGYVEVGDLFSTETIYRNGMRIAMGYFDGKVIEVLDQETQANGVSL